MEKNKLRITVIVCLMLSPFVMAQAQAPAPSSGTIVYDVRHGGGMKLGEAEFSWAINDKSYSMQNKMHTTGLAAKIRKFSYGQKSEGVIADGLLRPHHFEAQKDGNKHEWADFDWSSNKVELHRKDQHKTADLNAAAQDVLSIWYSAPALSATCAKKPCQVISGGSDKAGIIERLADDKLALTDARLNRTSHYRLVGQDKSLAIDLWYALDMNNILVRVRVEKDNLILDQQARTISLRP